MRRRGAVLSLKNALAARRRRTRDDAPYHSVKFFVYVAEIEDVQRPSAIEFGLLLEYSSTIPPFFYSTKHVETTF